VFVQIKKLYLGGVSEWILTAIEYRTIFAFTPRCVL